MKKNKRPTHAIIPLPKDVEYEMMSVAYDTVSQGCGNGDLIETLEDGTNVVEMLAVFCNREYVIRYSYHNEQGIEIEWIGLRYAL